ncbi:Endoglucanase precursor [Planococcus massiliensis]|uniref:Endoglucanase n=1 Tax=Planococcus massiliensis TaxID=1499687 RepID=A0A098EJP3_9BACL|nr:S-layer homology domain-containing protein [Planococcus massiliensis]CEG22015.1 Endoglucanase precursor [Planococcus massiliensis]
MSKNKNTKMFLAGTMALSSVVAVGIPVAADAAPTTPEEAATKLAEEYVKLTTQKQNIVNATQHVLSVNVGDFIDPNYSNYEDLKGDLANLIEAPTSRVKSEVEAEALARMTTFLGEAQSYLKDEGDLQDMFNFANSISTDLMIELNQAATTGQIITVLENSITKVQAEAPASVKEILVKPTDTQLNTMTSQILAALSTGGGGNNGGAPTTPTPPVTPPTTTPGGEIEATPDTLKNNPEEVIEAIQNAPSVTELAVDVKPGEAVSIPLTIASALENKNADAVIVIASTEASYELPVSVIDAAKLAKDLGVASSELSITVELTKIANQLTKENSIGFAIEFSIKAVAPDGKSIDITYLGYPVLRSIETPTALNAATSVGVRVNQDGSFTAVPTYIDGKTANLYFSANSAYTVIQNAKTFKDIDNRGYWAEEYIEKLASKMIVSGKSADSFSPSTSITRGEFAAVLARGLGLVAEDVNSADFTDVSPTQAVNRNGEIAAVVEAGIVSGYGNGKFGPYNEITRNEAAIMISKAMDYIGSEDVKLDTTKKVSSFADYRYISPAARPHVERVLQASYLSGFKDNTFRSQNETTRAETSRILYNFLNSIKFIN